MVDNNLYEPRVPYFNGALKEDYHLWDLRIEIALESSQLAGGGTNEDLLEGSQER